MRVLRFQIRQPSGQIDQLFIDSERVLIGSGGHCEIRFENCRVPVGNLLGASGAGFKLAQARLGPGRIQHCMRWIGAAQRSFEMMCAYSLKRQSFGEPLARKQTVQTARHVEQLAARRAAGHARGGERLSARVVALVGGERAQVEPAEEGVPCLGRAGRAVLHAGRV